MFKMGECGGVTSWGDIGHVRIVQKLTMGERLKEVTTGMILFDSV
jgi:hypothetical protein